ncbi:MAG TPA: PspA/IM30 family protein [Thermomicrobiales bacterium]
MGIMDRLSRLVRANINELIDSAENPEVMLNQILRDMDSAITQARQQVQDMLVQQKLIEADRDEARRLADEWAAKARRAVQAGKDDLAREALRRKRDNESNAQVYEQQVQTQAQVVEKLKEQLRQLEAKYQATLSRRDTLIARHRAARATAQVAETLTSFSPFDPTADLERMERKIRASEAKAAAIAELSVDSFDREFQELDDPEIETELALLKAGISGAEDEIDAELRQLKGEGASPSS